LINSAKLPQMLGGLIRYLNDSSFSDENSKNEMIYPTSQNRLNNAMECQVSAAKPRPLNAKRQTPSAER
jgi:hypothetical protein